MSFFVKFWLALLFALWIASGLAAFLISPHRWFRTVMPTWGGLAGAAFFVCMGWIFGWF